MKQITAVISLVFLALLAVGMGKSMNIAIATDGYVVTGNTLIADSFNRTLAASWGSADLGGKYSLAGGATNFNVDGAEGTLLLGARNTTRSAYLNAVKAQSLDATLRVKTNSIAQGGGELFYLITRRTGGGNDYLARLRFTPDGHVMLQAGKQVSGVTRLFGSEVPTPNLTYTANSYVRLRVQVVNTFPTLIRLRAWADGSAEPGAWPYSVSDSTASLQQAGAVGVRVSLSGTNTKPPVTFGVDDLQVVSTGSANPTPTPLPTITSPTPTPSTGPSSQIYWGTLVKGAVPPTTTNMQPGGVFDTFEQHAGKKLAIIHFGQPWENNGTLQQFQPSWFDNTRNHGSIPLIDWGSWETGYGPNQPNFQLSDIYNGNYDSFIAQWATAAKTWGHPFFLRFDWEMNGWWQFPWSEQLNGNQPGDYVKAWRHVHDIFTQNGATNVTWVWCPNIASDKSTPMSSLYPGDNYVDWTCLDGYNKESTWLRFNQVFAAVGINWIHNSYQEILNVAPSKPIMIAETASLEAGDGGAKKAAWIQDAYLTQLPTYFPKIKAVLWFNWNDGNTLYTFPIESSSAAQNAFMKGMGSSYYAANNFGNLNTSPIPPPP